MSVSTQDQTWNWVIESPGQWVVWVIFHVRVTGSSFWPGVRPEFFRFSKKCPKCKTSIWNAEMTKVIVRCLLLDWNHWMSVHAMNFYFYLWLLKNFWPENTASHIRRHLKFIVEQGHRVNWVSGSLDSRVTGSQNVTQLHLCSRLQASTCMVGSLPGLCYVGGEIRNFAADNFLRDRRWGKLPLSLSSPTDIFSISDHMRSVKHAAATLWPGLQNILRFIIRLTEVYRLAIVTYSVLRFLSGIS